MIVIGRQRGLSLPSPSLAPADGRCGCKSPCHDTGRSTDTGMRMLKLTRHMQMVGEPSAPHESHVSSCKYPMMIDLSCQRRVAPLCPPSLVRCGCKSPCHDTGRSIDTGMSMLKLARHMPMAGEPSAPHGTHVTSCVLALPLGVGSWEISCTVKDIWDSTCLIYVHTSCTSHQLIMLQVAHHGRDQSSTMTCAL